MTSEKVYLIQEPGEARVERWDKRRWNNADPVAKKVVMGYMAHQWDLVAYEETKNYAQAELEQHMTLNVGEKGWHHSKTLTIDLSAGKVLVRNGTTFISGVKE